MQTELSGQCIEHGCQPQNKAEVILGSRQEGGAPIGDVELPPWAHGDPRLFVELHREALESDFVSANIHHWIDLIFGYKQRGQAALDAVNVFQEVSYEGTVSLDAIDDDRERSSVLGAMCNWGLTPSQIFEAPHPARAKQPKHALEPKSMITASTCSALIQSIVPIRDIRQPIGQIHPGINLEKTLFLDLNHYSFLRMLRIASIGTFLTRRFGSSILQILCVPHLKESALSTSHRLVLQTNAL
ncbi:hypothetical protein PGTUg99_009635 [Puccinia graminis f. sp. tritici]|uniref:BEACH domain-containing protein n=1 Tax=Puccinia graminis f. sp. tritici TaxID=56615 RepID=A0A5B0RJG7_PUCGR|nr:hypothetical protein PGTUg99_009635 [Puccinia graminis f. sp. tritici]